jgi:hypothetical protein
MSIIFNALPLPPPISEYGEPYPTGGGGGGGVENGQCPLLGFSFTMGKRKVGPAWVQSKLATQGSGSERPPFGLEICPVLREHVQYLPFGSPPGERAGCGDTGDGRSEMF